MRLTLSFAVISNFWNRIFLAKSLNLMTLGYRLGVFNQRGVHWVDPEGKPERALAAKYQQRADAAERLGYSRFSELLRSVASGFISEADYNACHVHEDED